jgi:hypothetical protein
MSHFSVLVITETKPDKDELGRILQPWHEFKSTGVRDQYVTEVDITDQVVEEFNKPKDVVMFPAPFGLPELQRVVSRWSDEFYTKEPTEKWDRKEFELPAGAEIKTMTAEEARAHGIGYATLQECAKEYFGEDTIERDGKFYDLTNPNKKWDWWSIGGRWTGMLIPHYDPNEDPRNKETCSLCHGTGKRKDMPEQEKCNGCAGTGISKKWPTQWARIEGDQMRLGDVPLVTLRDEAERKALNRYDQAQKIIKGRPIPDWDQVVEKHFKDYAQARDEYNNDPVIVELRKAKILNFFDAPSDFKLSREQIARRARANVICPFAFVRDGKWYERGKMGWWAAVSDEKDRDAWAEEFNKMLDAMPPDSWLSVIDSHI